MNQYGGGDYAAEMNNEEGDKIPSMHNVDVRQSAQFGGSESDSASQSQSELRR